MSEDALRAMFYVSPSNRLELIKSGNPQIVSDRPYVSLEYRELNPQGTTVHLYRYWETLAGNVYGAEQMDREGNILERKVNSQRAANHPIAQDHPRDYAHWEI